MFLSQWNRNHHEAGKGQGSHTSKYLLERIYFFQVGVPPKGFITSLNITILFARNQTFQHALVGGYFRFKPQHLVQRLQLGIWFETQQLMVLVAEARIIRGFSNVLKI